MSDAVFGSHVYAENKRCLRGDAQSEQTGIAFEKQENRIKKTSAFADEYSKSNDNDVLKDYYAGRS